MAPILTMRPAVDGARCGRAACEALSAVSTLSACMRCHVLTSPSPTVSKAKPPAMLTNTSSPPKCLAAASTAIFACAASDRSTPPISMRSGIAEICDGAWSMPATRAPRDCAVSATTFPSAPSAPVTIRTLPCIIVLPARPYRIYSRLRLQIARLQCGPFRCAELETVAQVGFEIAILATDGLESSGKIRGLDGADRVENIGGKIGDI